MFDGLVDQLLKSGAGAELLQTIQAQGLTAPQAMGAVTATAEGAAQHMGSSGGLAGALGGLLGGGGLGALLGNSAPAGGSLGGFAPAIAGFVAEKTGLAPAMAQTVVSLVLPKIEAMISGAGR